MAKVPTQWNMETDVVVVGSGSGALTSAIRTHDLGGKAIVLERAGKLGGGTAYSGGRLWIPNNHKMTELGIKDSRDDAMTYLRAGSGGNHSPEVMEAFVDHGPRAIRYLEEHAGVQFEVCRDYPDYYAEWPGGKAEGRFLEPRLFDARQLGDWQSRVRTSPHIPLATTDAEMREWGGSIKVRQWDWNLIGQRMADDIRGHGAAYVCYLLAACLRRGCTIFTGTRARQLILDDAGRVEGVRAEQGGRTINVRARRGVLLACGGYEWNEELKSRFPSPHYWGHTPPTNEGDGLIMALEVGAGMISVDYDISVTLHVPGEEHEGKPLYRIFFPGPGAPGMIVVNRDGKRFYNESFWRAFTAAVCNFDGITLTYPNVPCYAVFDQRHKDTYAIGPAMPGEEAPGWIQQAPTLAELAGKLQVNTSNLVATLGAFNENARKGKDPVFHRGETLYDRKSGDPAIKPNPCLYPIDKPPFYGFEIQLGSGGTHSGLIINRRAQVQSVRDGSIPGLYACPNTAAHLVEGRGYTSGLCLGQSTVFGFLAAEDVMGASESQRADRREK